MKSKLLFAALIGALTCSFSFAQNSSPAAAPTTGEPRIAPGTVISVQLTKTVDAKKAKTGDEVLAKVAQAIKTKTGEVLVPKDTKVIGHVTEAQARHKDEKQSLLAINFNQAMLKDQAVHLSMSIQAVIGIENNIIDNAYAGGGDASAPSAAHNGATSPMVSHTPTSPPGQLETPSNAPSTNGGTASKRPPINGQTQGVIGISDLTLAPAANGAQGSVLTSEKNNVKLESGTMLLLKVSQ